MMKTAGAALGRLFNNLRNPKWLFQQAAETGFSVGVINPAGKQVNAWIRGHLLHEDQKIGEVYHCADGHEYIRVGNKIYNHDLRTDTWYDATPKFITPPPIG